jgi:hypothetical protein
MKTAAKKTTPARKSKPSGPLVAKVFKSGNSQAIRIPGGVALKAKSYLIEPNNRGGIDLIDAAVEARRLKALRELWGSVPDFPDHTT